MVESIFNKTIYFIRDSSRPGFVQSFGPFYNYGYDSKERLCLIEVEDMLTEAIREHIKICKYYGLKITSRDELEERKKDIITRFRTDNGFEKYFVDAANTVDIHS